MTTKTSSTKTSVQYPFETKKQIQARLEHDAAYVSECLSVLDDRLKARSPGDKAMGVMKSHESAAKALVGCTESWTDEQIASARKIVLSYTTQLAKHFRAERIAANPDLAETAKLFSADV